MIDNNEEQVTPPAEIVKAEPRQEVQPHSEMDINQARGVLQAIVDTHEDSITMDTPLDRIGGHSTEEIQQAESIVVRAIMEDASVENNELFGSILDKDTPQGKLILGMTKDGINLGLRDEKGFLLSNVFPLKNREFERSDLVHFSDSRSGERQVTDLKQLKQNFSLEGFRHLVRGVRWMNANILNWENPTTIMPEELDNLPTSKDSVEKLGVGSETKTIRRALPPKP